MFWKTVGLAYGAGLILIARANFQKRSNNKLPMSVEDQLDIAIHSREIESRAHRVMYEAPHF